MKDEFSFGTHSSKCLLQDFHHPDQFHPNGFASNPIFGVQTHECSDSLDNFTYGFSTDQCKLPFAENGGDGHVMDNFQNGGYLSFPQKNPGDIMATDHQGPMAFTTSFQDVKPVNFVVPDEVSCITAEIGSSKKFGMNKNRALPTTTREYKGRKKSNLVKGQWTIEEDRILIQLVQQYGVRKWSHIAQMLPAGRIGKQCRERWHNHLRPDIKKDTWSEEEDKVLIQAHAEVGNKWAEIAKRLPGRTENSIKNHWNATKRRQFSKRKCRSKYPRSSLLQEYIKSLNLDSNTVQNRTKTNASNDATTIHDNTQLKLKALITQPKVITTEFNHPDNSGYYDFHEVLDFCFDGNMSRESCSIGSLLGDYMHCALTADKKDLDEEGTSSTPHVVDQEENVICDLVVDEKDFEMDVPVLDMNPEVECELNKELDLVEMISQIIEVKSCACP
ncbi:hypothetical protein I3843_12G027200 [Carya illinoinensis]|uniref:Uncharacterized protein n=1 Tax=Carya illinoinensis TaxID=32201 RepID=A0A922IVR4_CARIL|nr:hypothetical protein I3842_12G026100 [Carya illinoinensis]KAG7951809.1 hypothetical protein I3843_12G027200 [Carya illinoinensis]